MAPSGKILRIEKLSSFDGNGLRTVVFLKGCPLRCQWCSTPESHEMQTDFGNDQNKCTRCFSCVEACPKQAISFDLETECFITDRSKCTDCRQCIHACPNGSRMAWGYLATIDEVFREIEKDSVFYYHSGGGVTVSGGEPLLQKTFVKGLLEKCVMHGINTAVETCGNVLWENIKSTLPFIDTLFYDLKHMGNATHKAITGVGNRLIMNNLKKIDTDPRDVSIIIRMPVIPKVNDQDINIRKLGEFCQGLKKLREIQFLPYHRFGIETYKRLYMPYALEGLESPSNEEMGRKVSFLKDLGLKVKIGG